MLSNLPFGQTFYKLDWTGQNLLTDNTLKKITQDVQVRCSVIMSDHNVKLAGHFQNLIGQCPVTDHYFQHCHVKQETTCSCSLLINFIFVLSTVEP